MKPHGPVSERFMRHHYGASMSEKQPHSSDNHMAPSQRANIVAVLSAVDDLLAQGGYAADSSARHQIGIAASMLSEPDALTGPYAKNDKRNRFLHTDDIRKLAAIFCDVTEDWRGRKSFDFDEIGLVAFVVMVEQAAITEKAEL